MTVAAAKRFVRSPKGLLLIVLAVLAVLGAWSQGFHATAPGVHIAVLVSTAIDAPILWWRKKRWEFPSGAVLTGLIVAMILSPQEPLWVTAVISAVAIVSKYLLRTTSANIFNPAALAIVATFYVFDTGQSWWGALPDLPWWGLGVLIGSGIFIADRVNKMSLVLAFLGMYFLLFTATAYAAEPRRVAELFRAPDLHAALYFAFFILTDPPTSPVRIRPQLVCGVIVAVVSFAVFEWLGAAYYLLAGVLAGNVYEAIRRAAVRRR